MSRPRLAPPKRTSNTSGLRLGIPTGFPRQRLFPNPCETVRKGTA